MRGRGASNGERAEVRPRVSVIIAAHKSRGRIDTVLESLVLQTLDRDLFEVVVVVNGEDDGTAEHVRSLRAMSLPLEIRVVCVPDASASIARNLGIRAARGEFLTFVDDDDSVSPEFLSRLLRHAARERVVIAPIADVVEGEQPTFDNYLNRALFRFAGAPVAFADAPDAASANGSKLIATEVARKHRYRQDLASGEDVAYWAELIAAEALDIVVCPPGSGAVYYRAVRPESVSRTLDRRFAEDRLQVIRHLRDVSATYPEQAAPLHRLEVGQAGNLSRYLAQHPDDRTWLLDRILELGMDRFPYRRLNRDVVETLVVAYAFPPYNDTSALVVGRRLAVARRAVDVLTQSMDNIRDRDERSLELVRESVHLLHRLPGRGAFAHWGRIADFVTRGEGWISKTEAGRGKPYREIYSRTMFPAAHILAAVHKLNNPAVRWVAEFSDPMSIDSAGEPRVSLIPDGDEVLEAIESGMRQLGHELPADRNLWELVELLAYCLADEVVFTNPNQRTFMVDRIASSDLRERVVARSRADRHPTLPERFYDLEKPSYYLDPAKVNIGYFGVFYAVRGVGDLLNALAGLDAEDRSRIALHVFTNKPGDTRNEVASLGLDDCVVVQPYVPYFEFLALSRRFDWLVVTDARAGALHGINPYLPSKYSDYAGSGSRIWSMVEPGSVLESLPADAVTHLGDLAGALEVLRTALGQWDGQDPREA